MAVILLTGGTGYVGSHTCVELIGAGHETVVLDNLCNSSPVAIDRIEKITGRRPLFIEGDIRDRTALDRAFGDRRIDAVVHCGGLKAVSDSIARRVSLVAAEATIWGPSPPV